MKKQSFRYSLLGFIGLLIILMILISGFSVLVINSIEDRYSNMIDKMLAINGIGTDINSSVFYFDKYFTTKSQDDMDNYEKYYSASVNKLTQVDVGTNQDLQINLKDLKNLIHNYHGTGEFAINKFKKSGKNEDWYKYFIETKQISTYSGEYVKRVNDSYLKYNDNVYKVLKYKTSRGRNIILLFLLTTIIFCVIFSAYFSRLVTVPMGELASSAEEISRGNFEISTVDSAGVYEIDMLQEGFKKMAQEIKLLIEKIQGNAIIEKRLNEQELRNLLVENMLKESQLKALQSQINPHFLFNTLNAIAQTAIIEGAEETENLINAVSELLRYSLSMIDRKSKVETEISIIKQYIIIQETRFKDRIKFNIEADSNLGEIQVPGMILQPLVENAFVHGIENREEGGIIGVKVYREGELCVIEVRDNGCGINKDRLTELMGGEYISSGGSTGIGVKNVIKRLKIMYRNVDVFNIESEINKGTTISIRIPIDRGTWMLNILIADDEELERRTIITILNNNFPGNFNVYEAKNGREAIEISDKIKPDILIVDIKMPGINGITAIKEIRKFLKTAYCIVLTAYDYFDYAKEAIEYDVREYMLKPFKRVDFITKIQTAVTIIEEEKRKRHEEIVLKEKIYTLIPMMENELCYSIMNNNVENIDYLTYLNYLGISFDLGCSVVLRVKPESSSSERINLKFKINEFVREFLKRQNNAITSCIFSEDIVIFLDIQDKLESLRDSDKHEGMVQKLLESLKNKFNIQVIAGIGNVYSTINKLTKSYQEALIVLSNRQKEVELNGSMLRDYSIMEAIYSEEMPSPKIGRDGYEDGRNIIVKAIDYINENFKKDIMLEEVAAVVNISSFYFSKVFKEYTGKNYVDYITELRIEIAKQKLKEGIISIKEICYEVGYNDPNYFSRVFKKVEGLSPTEYKSKFCGRVK